MFVFAKRAQEVEERIAEFCACSEVTRALSCAISLSRGASVRRVFPIL
jgi:hypothetical protein